MTFDALASVIAVAAGGALGGVARWRLAQLGAYRGTLVANTLACAVLGVLSHLELDAVWLLFCTTGLAGALSTWSTLARELGELWRAEKHARAWVYGISTLACGVLAMLLGSALMP
ncbi:FluC/FEX family fluoride channel [Corynebacterium gerontici]|uniref:Fluoride-specific ion channel FluC n=1 Tax=Corynebacterium gerontici TaxID=2079234 RepID=A0A3G6IYN7_9CORY|nr:CrcB family protein [Corynebacterium gerontici]AZA10766.1 Putative fluoride ion transporter CrcB [Corynebacterium gerontici]